MKRIIFVILALAIVLSAWLCFAMIEKENLRTLKVCFQDNCFAAELAETSEQRMRGLMFRESMDANKGMLFVFEKEGEHFFWMKNTLIALDIIWINENKEVVFIARDVEPCNSGGECERIKSNEPAKYVLELNAGIADKINLKIGDELFFNLSVLL